MVLLIISSLFIAISIFFETVGAKFRYIGSANGEAALGYSSHVRLATTGRFFILCSSPLIGYIVDGGAAPRTIALIGLLTFFLSTIMSLIAKGNSVDKLLIYIYNKMNDREFEYTTFLHAKTSKSTKNIRFILFASLSFVFTASGIIIVNYIASNFNAYRAMLVQTAAVITMFGTIVHAFYLDPYLARSADQNKVESYIVTNDYIRGRLWGSLILFCIFLILTIHHR